MDQRLSCLSDGSLMSCSAQALVTLVNARLRFSKFPKEPELNRRARSASYRTRGGGGALMKEQNISANNLVCVCWGAGSHRGLGGQSEPGGATFSLLRRQKKIKSELKALQYLYRTKGGASEQRHF